MRPGLTSITLLLLLLVLAAFVWQSGSAMPEVVASQFGSGGAAHRSMARDTYVALMLVLVVGVPLLMALLPAAIAGHDGSRLDIPHRDYWLAPDRRENTLAFIRSHGQGAATVSALFLAYVHWLVVDANRQQPPELSTAGIMAGLVVLLMLLAVGLAVFHARFRTRS